MILKSTVLRECVDVRKERKKKGICQRSTPEGVVSSMSTTVAPEWRGILEEATSEVFEVNAFSNDTSFNASLTLDEYIEMQLGPKHVAYYTLVPLTVVYVLIAVAGVLGNLLTCIVVVKNHSMRTSTNYYLVNLAVTDVITLILVLPVEVHSMWEQYPWRWGDVACRVRAIVSETVALVSVLTILAVSGERYVAITDPVIARTTHTLTRTTRVLPAMWLAAFIAAIPWGYYHQVNELTIPANTSLPLPPGTVLPESKWCAVPFHDDSTGWAWLMWVSSVVAFILPMVVLVTLYSKIGVVLAIDPPTRTPAAAAGAGAIHTRKLGIRMLVAVVVVFFLCWAPFHAQRLMFAIVTLYGSWTTYLRSVNSNLYYFTGICYYLNSAVNPVLYSIMSVRFRVAFRRSLCGGKEWARRQLFLSNTYAPQIVSNNSNILIRTREISTTSTKLITRMESRRLPEAPTRNGFDYVFEQMDYEA